MNDVHERVAGTFAGFGSWSFRRGSSFFKGVFFGSKEQGIRIHKTYGIGDLDFCIAMAYSSYFHLLMFQAEHLGVSSTRGLWTFFILFIFMFCHSPSKAFCSGCSHTPIRPNHNLQGRQCMPMLITMIGVVEWWMADEIRYVRQGRLSFRSRREQLSSRYLSNRSS